MKKLFRQTLLLFCFSLIANAQDFQGIAIYKTKTTIDLDLDSRGIPEARKQQIRQRIKNAMEQSFQLTFDRTASIYAKEEKLESPSATGNSGGGFRIAVGGANGILYKNVQEQTYFNQTETFGKIFLVRDSLIDWKWKLGSETKKIGNYTCYKATVVQKVDSTMAERFRRLGPGPRGGRDGSSNQERQKDSVKTDSTESNTLLSRIEPPRDRTITAWYTPEILVSHGPANYWGLPGLILEVNDGRTAVLCSKIVLNPEEKIVLKAPKKGKEVTQEEYDKILTEKMEEMSKRFRGGNRRGEGGVFRIRG